MPQINTEVLRWARESAGFNLQEAANKLSIKPERLEEYENGKRELSRPALKNLSKHYRKPVLTFYMQNIPAQDTDIVDFRTLPRQENRKDGAIVDTLTTEIKASQSLIREAMIDEDEAERIAFVGTCSHQTSPSALCNKIKAILKVDLANYRQQKNSNEAFKLLRAKAEQAGIFVVLKNDLGSHHTKISVEQFRGFVISDDVAPFIVINSSDSKAAMTFTLLHEIAHLLLGDTGIVGYSTHNTVEQLCNDASSEFLLPKEEFESFSINNTDIEDAAEQISAYARGIKVSKQLVAYRLFKRGDLTKSQWNEVQEVFKTNNTESKQTTKKSKGGPSHYIVKCYSLGALAKTVKRFSSSGTLTPTKAGVILGVSPLKVQKFLETMTLS